MRRSLVLLSVAVVLSGCGVLQAMQGERLASRAVIIASCMERWDPGSAATRTAQRAADRARSHAVEVDEALAAQVRTMRAVRVARAYAEDAIANAPGVTRLWTEFASRAARARAFRTDRIVAPAGLFDLAEEALSHLEAAIEAYDRIEGDRLAVSVLGTWAGGGPGSDPWQREILRSARTPEDVAAGAFAHPDRVAVARLRGSLDRVRSRIVSEDDSGVIAALDELGERSRSVFAMADADGPRDSVGEVARGAVGALRALEDAELRWLEVAAAAYRELLRQLHHAEQAAIDAQPDCLPTGPLMPDPRPDQDEAAPTDRAPRLSPAPAAAPGATPERDVAAPGG